MEFRYLGIWGFQNLDIWNLGISEFGDLDILEFGELGNCLNCCYWKNIIKVVFALVRSGNNKNNKKETGCLLTTATISGFGCGKNIELAIIF